MAIEKLKTHIIEKLRESRQKLLEVPKDQLSGLIISNWNSEWSETFHRADNLGKVHLWLHIQQRLDGFHTEEDSELCLELRTRIIELMDETILAIDSEQVVTPVLDDLISRVADRKLSTLLIEFNQIRTDQPNLAASGFRTILPLIIRERAKKVDDKGELATKDDIKFEPDITAAIKHPSLFKDAEKKLLKRYLDGRDKDSFDNVVHKPDYLIVKDELSDATGLLNRLLPTIVD